MKNPVIRALALGFASAAAVAGPLVDNGVKPSEAIAIAVAFLTGTGLVAVPTGREVAPVESLPNEADPIDPNA